MSTLRSFGAALVCKDSVAVEPEVDIASATLAKAFGYECFLLRALADHWTDFWGNNNAHTPHWGTQKGLFGTFWMVIFPYHDQGVEREFLGALLV